MNVLNSLHNAMDNFMNYIDPIVSYQMTPDYAAFVIQKAYRHHLIRKYFNHLKHCTPIREVKEPITKRGWFA